MKKNPKSSSSLEELEKDSRKEIFTRSHVVGIVAVVFLLIGYETALFVHKAATLSIIDRQDKPDTVYVVDSALAARLLGASGPGKTARPQTPRGQAGVTPSGTASAGGGAVPGSFSGGVVVRREADHSPAAEAVRANAPGRHVESFDFNPNTVSVEDLVRLGFSLKQAESIENYREKGGRFYRKSDFAKSYVVADSVFRRLEKHIRIPRLELNSADSAAFDDLPGIGGYFASRFVAERAALGGYSDPRQLMGVYRFDEEKYSKIKDLVYVDSTKVRPYPLWSLPADSLKLHPYIRNWSTAKAIVLYRENTPRSAWTVEGLRAAGVLPDDSAALLSLCRLAPPR